MKYKVQIYLFISNERGSIYNINGGNLV